MNEIAVLNNKLKKERRKRFFALLHFRRQLPNILGFDIQLAKMIDGIFLIGYDKGVENGMS